MSQKKELWPTPKSRDWKGGLGTDEERQKHDLDKIVLLNGLPLSPEASHVNLTRLQESVKALLTSVISGRSSGVSLARLNPDGSWRKMYQEYSQAMLDGSLEPFSLTWPKWGTLLDGLLMEQLTWVRYIDETESLLWATMTVGDIWESRTSVLQGVEKHHLNAEAKMWPTPTASDAETHENDKIRFQSLAANVHQQTTGQLNPTWVEWLQGFPLGWTDLDASETQ